MVRVDIKGWFTTYKTLKLGRAEGISLSPRDATAAFTVDLNALYIKPGSDRRAQCARHVLLAKSAPTASHDQFASLSCCPSGCRDTRCVGRERQLANAMKVHSETRAEVIRSPRFLTIRRAARVICLSTEAADMDVGGMTVNSPCKANLRAVSAMLVGTTRFGRNSYVTCRRSSPHFSSASRRRKSSASQPSE